MFTLVHVVAVEPELELAFSELPFSILDTPIERAWDFNLPPTNKL
jgi:hypothetical protein